MIDDDFESLRGPIERLRLANRAYALALERRTEATAASCIAAERHEAARRAVADARDALDRMLS